MKSYSIAIHFIYLCSLHCHLSDILTVLFQMVIVSPMTSKGKGIIIDCIRKASKSHKKKKHDQRTQTGYHWANGPTKWVGFASPRSAGENVTQSAWRQDSTWHKRRSLAVPPGLTNPHVGWPSWSCARVPAMVEAGWRQWQLASWADPVI